MSAAAQPRRQYAPAKREPWGVRPASRPANSHVPHYVTVMQDALARRVGPLWTYQTMWEMGEPIDNHRRILRGGSLSALAIYVGRKFDDKPVPRSTLRYWIERIALLKLAAPWNETAGRIQPRTRGDGRHKTTWVINSWNRGLDLIAADPNIATPKNRTFWVLDGKPLSTAEAAEWKLDAAVAERMPQAWENNARFYDPNAPMKPLRRTVRPAGLAADDIEAIHAFLAGEQEIATTPEQAAEILRWARAEADAIPAAALITLLRGQIQSQVAQDRKSRRVPVFNIKFFARERVRGAAHVWKQSEAKRRADEAAAAKARAEMDSAGYDLPPDD